MHPPVRLAFAGGEPVTQGLVEQFTAVFGNARLISVGGPTETTLWNTMYPIDPSDIRRQRIPYGKPIANTQYYVLNESLEDRPVWVTGELCCAGNGLAKGYWKDEEKTKSAFVRHPDSGQRLYKTGDLGRYLPDGNIEILGRNDFQLKIRGHRIEAGEIESTLNEHPRVQSSLAKSFADAEGENRLVVYAVRKPDVGQDVDPSELRAFLRRRLPEQMLPSFVFLLDKLPLLPNGKIDRNRLPLPALDSKISTSESLPNEDDVTDRMAEIVREVLKIDSLKKDVNWFSIGATSIDIIRILNRLEHALFFRPRIDQVYDTPNISGLISLYRQNRSIDLGFEPACEPISDSYKTKVNMIKDPYEREKFRASHPAVRSMPKRTGVQLNHESHQDRLEEKYLKRRSYRKFQKEPITFEKFSKFLGCLRQIRVKGNPKYLYPSAGGLYSVQTYLYIKRDRVQGISVGTYYYHPIDHRLYPLAKRTEIDRTIYGRLYNRVIFDEAAFAIFLVGDLDAILPMYGPNSVHLATLDSGYMSQLLSTTAVEHQIGLCSIGSLNFSPVRHLFSLNEGQILLHSLLGGRIHSEITDRCSSAEIRTCGFEEGEI